MARIARVALNKGIFVCDCGKSLQVSGLDKEHRDNREKKGFEAYRCPYCFQMYSVTGANEKGLSLKKNSDYQGIYRYAERE